MEEATTSARLLKVLADHLRLQILSILRRYEGRATVEDIVYAVGEAVGTMSQQAISHHLRVMRDAGFIDARKRGLYTCYSIREQALSEVLGIVIDLLPKKSQRRKSA
jgi:ArsR family transcriptional regulator